MTERYRNLDGELHRLDGPAIVNRNGSHEWYRNGMLHRDGGPAYTNQFGDEMWIKHGKRHRVDGPAFSSKQGNVWYVNGRLCTSNREYQQATGLTDEQMMLLIIKYGNIIGII